MCFDSVHGCACDVGWVTDWWVCGFASFYNPLMVLFFSLETIFFYLFVHITHNTGALFNFQKAMPCLENIPD